MTRTIFFGSVLLCILCIGLSQVTDIGVFGIHEETSRILYYGGSGLLGGLAGLIAIISGIYLSTSQSARISRGQRRVVVGTLSILLIAALAIFFVRSGLLS